MHRLTSIANVGELTRGQRRTMPKHAHRGQPCTSLAHSLSGEMFIMSLLPSPPLPKNLTPRSSPSAIAVRGSALSLHGSAGCSPKAPTSSLFMALGHVAMDSPAL